MSMNMHVMPARAGRCLLVAALLVLLIATGCAKHPSATSPVGQGKATGQGICETARSKIGVRYKAGGTKPSTGFDCSGFVCWTFAQHGINLPRTSKEQAKAGTTINKKELRPGDLVVFKISSRTGTHSGIYSGNGKFIHSPSSGKTVCEESMNAPYWKSRFLTARRIPQVK